LKIFHIKNGGNKSIEKHFPIRENGNGSGGKESNHRHRHHIRVRQSHSLNRISELHAEDFLLGCDADESGCRQAGRAASGRGGGNGLQVSILRNSVTANHFWTKFDGYGLNLAPKNNGLKISCL
jgi:hypothetical protein